VDMPGSKQGQPSAGAVPGATPEEWRGAKRYVEVLGKRMAYVEAGDALGSPIVFLHGNPTSSYLWRNVMPHLRDLGRLIAPVLIGMGDSEKLPPEEGEGRYRLANHRRYLDAFLEAVGVESDVVLVVHDWGGPLGFDWANRHREAIRGLVYMETFVLPMAWEDLPEGLRPLLRSLRSNEGEGMILGGNAFVEEVLPGTILRSLSGEEMGEYRRPYLEPGEDRRPTLAWPREIPVDGDPEDVARVVGDYAGWLSGSDVPKLFVNAEPGAIQVGAMREFCRAWPNQTEVTVPGSHFVPEDSAEEIGRAIAAWYPATAPREQGRTVIRKYLLLGRDASR